jgi:hypothetical protein
MGYFYHIPKTWSNGSVYTGFFIQFIQASSYSLYRLLYTVDIHSELGQMVQFYTGILHQFYIQNDLLQKFTSFS